jgi:hypothetical protein
VNKPRTRLLTGVVVAVIAGCGPTEPSNQRSPAGVHATPLLDVTSRIRTDAVSHRVWSLTHAGLLFRDDESREARLIALPNWLWAHAEYGGCLPDVALGPTGEALITSNVTPILWRVDAKTLQVTEHRLSLNDDYGKEVGFTGLVYSAEHDAYFAVSAVHGSLWRIDPQLRKAQKVALAESLPGACALEARTEVRRTARIVHLCVRTTDGASHLVVAPDQRAAYLRGDRCVEQADGPDMVFVGRQRRSL